jgi:S1-C subfamily serine protease
MSQKAFFIRLGAITAALALLISFWLSVPLLQSSLLGRFSTPRSVVPRGDLSALEQSTIEVFGVAKNSVVFISTSQRVINPWTRNTYDTPSGTGSGFVWDELGHVITNHHVIDGASQAIIRLADGRAYDAYLVGTAPEYDLAVLQIGVGNDRPPPISIGSSSELVVGQSVLAIGNPFGLDWTLTTGIVSALDREIPSESGDTIRGLIQTDAAINPGNSGGPLLDSAGRLIGVNTAIFSPSGSSAGIGFSVPVDAVNRVVPQLIAKGRYAPPTLGVNIDPRGDALLSQTGVPGVIVLDVVPGSGAAAAGIRPARITRSGQIIVGDIIVSLDDQAITDAQSLRDALDTRRAGEQVVLGVIREGAKVEIPVVLSASN